jgi:hypothetical protein
VPDVIEIFIIIMIIHSKLMFSETSFERTGIPLTQEVEELVLTSYEKTKKCQETLDKTKVKCVQY